MSSSTFSLTPMENTLNNFIKLLKINLDKCVFGKWEVSYLGFTLMPEGIKPGKSKIKAMKDV
jgi:hypothetical protein